MAAPRAPLDPSAIAAERIDESGFCASCSVRLFDMKREREKRKEKPRRASSSGPTSQLLFREIHSPRDGVFRLPSLLAGGSHRVWDRDVIVSLPRRVDDGRVWLCGR